MEIESIISLAHMAYTTCRNAKENKEECLRIGDRLLTLMVCTSEWTKKTTSKRRVTAQKKGSKKSGTPSISTQRNLKKNLTNLNLVLQAATMPKKNWTSQVVHFMKSTKIKDAIAKSERELDSVLQEFIVQQNTELYRQNEDMFHEMYQQNQMMNSELVQIFNLLAQQTLPGSQGSSPITYEVHINQTLKKYQKEKPTALSTRQRKGSTQMGTSSSLSFDGSILSALPSDIQDELNALMLDDSLQCSFEKSDLLGQGSFAMVYSGTYKKNTRVAIKRLKEPLVKMSAEDKKARIGRFESEAALMFRSGVHPHIVQVMACQSTWEGDLRPMIVMELMETTLYAALNENKLPSFKQRAVLMRGIAEALEFLHLQGIVHRDVKSLNILLNGDDLTMAKLGDFGEAREKGFEETECGAVGASNCVSGTPHYHPPEVLLGTVTASSRKAEIYAFGVVLWECLTTETPHKNKTGHQLRRLAQDAMDKNKKRKFLLKIPKTPDPNQHLEGIDLKAWGLLRSVTMVCLKGTPKFRPTASELVMRMQVNNPNEFATYHNVLQQLRTQLSTSNGGNIGAGNTVQSPVGAGKRSRSTLPLGNVGENETPEWLQRMKNKRWFVLALVISILLVVLTVVITLEARSTPTQLVQAPTFAPSSSQVPTPPQASLSPTKPCFQSNSELKSTVNEWFNTTEQKISAESHYGPIGEWCFGVGVTSMNRLFETRMAFNEAIGDWDVSSVADMGDMFAFANEFNEDIGNWNVSSVTNMESMFFGASVFNQDIGNWDVSSVFLTNYMFYNARSFNQDLSKWQLSSVTNMDYMFTGGDNNFDQNLCAWGSHIQSTATALYMFGRGGFSLCKSSADPDLSSSPPGPFCHVCT